MLKYICFCIITRLLPAVTQVVYEDGDCEDLTPAEVRRLQCEESSISRSTVEAIMRKSEEFDFDNPEECFTGLIDVAPGADELEVTKDKDKKEDDEDNEMEDEEVETMNDWVKSEPASSSSATSSMKCPGGSDAVVVSGVKSEVRGDAEVIVGECNGTSSSSGNGSYSHGSFSTSYAEDNVGNRVTSSSNSDIDRQSGGIGNENSPIDSTSYSGKRNVSGISNGKSSGGNISADISSRNEINKNSKRSLISDGTRRKVAASIPPPAYNKNLGEKYIPCPQCQKMFHPSGIKNHMNRCGKQITTVGAATTTAAAGAAAGLGVAVSAMTPTSMASPVGSRNGPFQSPPRTGASSWSPISINSASSSMKSDVPSSNGTPSTNGTLSNDSPAAVSHEVTATKAAISLQYTRGVTQSPPLATSSSDMTSSELLSQPTTPLTPFSSKKRKHSPGSDVLQSASKLSTTHHEGNNHKVSKMET